MHATSRESERLMALDRQMMRPYLEHILELTSEMAQLALHERWYELMDRMDERAQVMWQLLIMAGDEDFGTVAALRQSVAESDQSMNRIMAHAVASARWQGAEHCLGN